MQNPNISIIFFDKSIVQKLFNLKVNFSLFCTEENQTLIITRLPVTRWVKLSLNFELKKKNFKVE